jgi:integrase
LPEALAVILQAQRSRSGWDSREDFVFCSDQGKPLDPDHLRRQVLYLAMRAAGIEPEPYTHGFHMFRHSAATIVEAETRNRALASELLGHTQESTTRGYVHVERVAEQATGLLARELTNSNERRVN